MLVNESFGFHSRVAKEPSRRLVPELANDLIPSVTYKLVGTPACSVPFVCQGSYVPNSLPTMGALSRA